MRRKQGICKPGDEPAKGKEDIQVIDVADYQPRRVPSKTWRECIKKLWEVDPLLCPRCNGSMKIVSFITEPDVIKQILMHLDLWQQKPSRSPPSAPDIAELDYEQCYDDWPPYEEPYFTVN